jgi:hypothetical protein
VARRRAQWKAYQGRLDPARLVFIDETWAKTNMTRLCGWAPRGRKLVAKAPQGRWRMLTYPHRCTLRHRRTHSPDRNTIAQVFAKLKTRLRNAAERTVEATWKRIGTLLRAFTSQECANYLRAHPRSLDS